MNINLVHRGLELTPAIKAYVEEKMATLQKFMEDIEQMDVEVGMSTHHHTGNVFLCRVNVVVHGEVIRVEREEADLYKAIDKVRDHLRETLAQAKKRELGTQQGKG